MERKIRNLWNSLYNDSDKLNNLLKILSDEKIKYGKSNDTDYWYKNAVIYSAYTDLFAENFVKFTSRLDYLKNLGINTLWLLPILESPMKDQGFDISDFYSVRKDLGNNDDFKNFTEACHAKNIKVVFDVAINHTSDQHEWFLKSKEKDEYYSDFYIWNKDDKKYSDARIIFKGIMKSNWQYDEKRKEYYFHRFYDKQPDLNYKNPDVFTEMIKMFLFWKEIGVDGFRMDAAPFLWKEEGTNCENLFHTHQILKLFRACLDYVNPGTILIAEANQKPNDVVEYFGKSDECHAAYHFPLMPKIYLAISEKKPEYISDILKEENTPEIPDNCKWFTFLRCHDEMTLEFVNAEERKIIMKNYLKNPLWNFREGEGISGRIYEFMDKNVQKVLLAYGILFSLDGAPIIYYGDEIAMENDYGFYEKMIKITGYADSRFLNRGVFDEEKMKKINYQESSPEKDIYNGLKEIIKKRNSYSRYFSEKPVIKSENGVLIVQRSALKIYNNLNDYSCETDGIVLKPYESLWINY